MKREESQNGCRKKAGIKRGKIKNPDLPKTTIEDWGMDKILSRIERAIELIYRRR